MLVRPCNTARKGHLHLQNRCGKKHCSSVLSTLPRTNLACRAKEAEVVALVETASQNSRGKEEAHKVAARVQAGAQCLEADIQRLQRHVTHLESTNRYVLSYCLFPLIALKPSLCCEDVQCLTCGCAMMFFCDSCYFVCPNLPPAAFYINSHCWTGHLGANCSQQRTIF